MALSPGMRVRAPFGPRRATGMVLSVFEGQPQRKLKSLEAAETEAILPAELLNCALWMSRRYSAPIGECIKAVLPAFVGNQAVYPDQRTGPAVDSVAPAFTLTSGQEEALKVLLQNLEAKTYGAALLYGVPASGKTEVYLRLIRQAVAAGGQALFLLPEISLTQPFFDEFSASLDVPVVLWHSRLTARQRRGAWWGLREGRVKVVVGARSAALLPFSNLRVVVMDEEQDESFKQEGQSPLYHARDIALYRARACDAVAVLGSATPSLETWEMARRKTLSLVRMPQRVSSVSRPIVSVVATPVNGCLSPELLEKLKDRLQKREQSILLVNRRGFSTLLMCHKCGWIDRCDSCGVAKIKHEEDGAFFLICHHCMKKSPVPEKCPRCANPGLRALGVGTQKVVAELKRALPGARILRMDRDSLTLKERDKSLYEKFRNGEADILVGTKLVAKSFHFPSVTLVGAIDADTMLHMPDFRASERTMQLLAQVAGRSGRADKAGEVLLQTLHPDHIAVQGTVAGDYGVFAEDELKTREELGYPPYRALVRLIWSGKNEAAVKEVSGQAAERLRQELSKPGYEVVGPAPAVLRLVSKKFRYHLLIKVPHAELEPTLGLARLAATPSGVKLKINVDPYDLF